MRVTRVLRSHLGDIDLQHSPSLEGVTTYRGLRSNLEHAFKLYPVQRLGEDIRDHLFGWAVNKLNLTCCSNVTDVMKLYVNVLVALVYRLILDRVDRALVIRMSEHVHGSINVGASSKS